MKLFQISHRQKEILTREEFEQVFDLHYAAVRNFLYYKCADAELSEDLAQDAFVKLWETREKIYKSTIKSYLHTIANNLLINHKKRSSLNFRFLNLQAEGKDNLTPEYLVEMQEFDRRLQATLARIPEKSREVFLMNRIDGLKYYEIADRLSISTKAVEKRVSRALAILREYIEYKI